MNIKYVLSIVIVLIVGVGVGSFFYNRVPIEEDEHHEDEMVEHYEIYPGSVVEKIEGNEDVVLLDVRTPEEYEEIHLENALLLPVEELSQGKLDEIGLGQDFRDKEIIIYCRSGARSKIAYNIMESLGYTNIKSVAGGMIHWQEDNYPFTEVGEYIGMKEQKEVDVSMGGPSISFDRTIHDFGDVPKSNGIIQTSFTVQNVGNENLEIGELSTSCGCTTAEISQGSIAPNEQATLTVYFDPDFHPEPTGEITRTIFIPTNDPSFPEAEVKITVDILENQ